MATKQPFEPLTVLRLKKDWLARTGNGGYEKNRAIYLTDWQGIYFWANRPGHWEVVPLTRDAWEEADETEVR